MPPTLVVDLDRVVLDSECAFYRLWRGEFQHRGLLLTTEAWAEYRARSADTVVDVLARRTGVARADLTDLADDLAHQHRLALAGLPARPGIAAWLRDAHRAGWRCAVLSYNDAGPVQDVLARLGLSEHITTDIQVGPGEPSRGHGKAASSDAEVLASFGADATRTIVISASPPGIARAKTAGCGCLAVPDKLNIHLLRPEPGVVIVDPELISFPQAVTLLDSSTTPAQPRTRGGPDRSDRIRGSLTGLALGDALGKLVGYRTTDQLDTETLQVLDALGAGGPPPAVFTGRVTDDTAMTLALADSIIAAGHVSRDAFQACLTAINPQGGWQVFKLKASAADQVVLARDGQTNGCVPRSAVLAFLHTPDSIGDLIYDVLKIGTLTHRDPSALAVAVLFALAVTHAVDGYSPRETREALEPLYDKVIGIVGGGEEACASLHRHTAVAERSHSAARYVDYLEDTCGIDVTARSSAMTGLCLGLAGLPVDQTLPLLLRRKTLGDLDSTAAVYGALAGAFHPNSIPIAWANRIDHYIGRTLHGTANQLDRIFSNKWRTRNSSQVRDQTPGEAAR